MKYLRLFVIGGLILATAGCATPPALNDDPYWTNIAPFGNNSVKP